MAEEDKAMKSLKLLTFDVYWFMQSIQQTEDPDLPGIEDGTIGTDNTGVKQRKDLKLNTIVVCNSTMLFTTDWPSGQANIIVVSLHEKYSPKDLISKIELHQDLNDIIMKRDEDSDCLFEKLLGPENQYNT
eukprot:10752573-Ditylum_brightwellii.AAC.1